VPTTSYTYPGGQGNRSSLITVTGTLGSEGGSLSLLVDGTTTGTQFNPVNGTITSGTYIRFDFGAGVRKYIDELRIIKAPGDPFNNSPGSWHFQGSNDGSSWTTLQTYTWNATADPFTVTVTSQLPPIEGFRYYQVVKNGNTSNAFNGSYLNEFEFKIAEGVTTNVGAASGSGTGTGVGASVASTVGSSTSISAVTAVGALLAAAAGNSQGQAVVDGVGQALAENSKGQADGISTALAVGETTIYATGSATSAATSQAQGASVAFAAGSSQGQATTIGRGAAVKDFVGSATGAATATAEGSSTAEAAGNAAGTCTVTAIQYIIAVGNASGTAIVFGDASTIAETDGLAVGSATVVGFLLADAEADGEVLAESLVNGIGASVAHAVGGDVEGIAEVLGIGSTITWGAEDGTSGTWTPEEAAPDGWIPEAAQGGVWTQ
jgi:hypothetical protein